MFVVLIALKNYVIKRFNRKKVIVIYTENTYS